METELAISTETNSRQVHFINPDVKALGEEPGMKRHPGWAGMLFEQPVFRPKARSLVGRYPDAKDLRGGGQPPTSSVRGRRSETAQ